MKTLRIVVLLSIGLTSCASAITLDAALAQTLDRNPEIQHARLAVEEASGHRVVLHAVAYPDARIDLFGGDQGGHRAGEPANQPFAFARGALTQPIFNAAVPASWRRGNVELLVAQQQLNVAVTGQLHAARVAFYTALYNKALSDLGQAQSERLSANAASEAERYRGGQTERSAVSAARSLEEELQPRIADAQRAYDGARLTLAQTIAAPIGPSTSLPKPEGDLRLRQVDFDLARESEAAVERRPDLQVARLLVEAAAEDQRIIEAAYYPAINGVVSGTYIPVSDVRRDSGGSPQRSNDVISSEVRPGVAFTWRVIDNGKTTGAVIRQRAVREMNELVLHRLEANVPRELERIRNTLRAVDARQKALAAAVTAADQNVTTVQQNLSEGLASQLDFRTAETSFLQTKTALLTAAFEQNVALAEWDRAAGRYFQMPAARGTQPQ